tara:strand:+ start:902 stop:1780 length:879 start_codon:yes stop_codon:yes gene_type:complete
LNNPSDAAAVLAVLTGSIALAAGLLLILLPLLASQLARPRDGLWAAVVLLLGLVLVTGAERLTGAPMLGVLCGGLLIGRLSTEVGQQRWQALEPSAREQLRQKEYWQTQLVQLSEALQKLLAALLDLLGWIKQRLRKPEVTKRWVRSEAEVTAAVAAPATSPEAAATEEEPEPSPAPEPSGEPDPAPENEAAWLAPASADDNVAAADHNPSAESETSEPQIIEAAAAEPEPSSSPAEAPIEPLEPAAAEPLPVVEADILDPEPQPGRDADLPAVSVITSLDEVDALLNDGRS